MTESTRDPARVVSQVEYEYGLKPGALASRDRTPHVSAARREAIKRLRTKPLALSYAEIGKMLRRDHTSIMTLAKNEVGKTRGKRVNSEGKKSGKARA